VTDNTDEKTEVDPFKTPQSGTVKDGTVTVFDPNDFKEKNKGVSSIKAKP
jgi:hypothetical protein